MNYISTRSTDETTYTSPEVILYGIAPDGGLFFPCKNVAFHSGFLKAIKKMPYYKRASAVLSYYLDDFEGDCLTESCKKAYSKSKFPLTPAPVSFVGRDCYLELYHGPTCAFKDLALQLMPRLLSMSIEKTATPCNAKILVATSGDTGKAALEGFKDVERVEITVFYPKDGVSEIQKKQMQTQKGKNVTVYGVDGNFDDCQTAVKAVFTSEKAIEALAENKKFFSSANSINFGRLVPQVAYYVSALADMNLSEGEKVNITVPTGNFGNILAAYMAKKAGMPIGKLICASNKNNVLTDFFNTGVYDKRREFYVTASPSMDILVSSNLERLLFLACGSNKTTEYMKSLKQNGFFSVDKDTLSLLQEDFEAFYADDRQAFEKIKEVYEKSNYLMDTHTAVASCGADMYKEKTGDQSRMLIVSTASPYKFAPDVCKALGLPVKDGFTACDELSTYTGTPIPKQINTVRTAKQRFTESISVSQIKSVAVK